MLKLLIFIVLLILAFASLINRGAKPLNKQKLLLYILPKLLPPVVSKFPFAVVHSF